MLVQVYRYGPSRQRIVKGYVIDGASKPVSSQLRALKCHQSIQLRFDVRAPNAVWLDTGMVWLHTAAARAMCPESGCGCTDSS